MCDYLRQHSFSGDGTHLKNFIYIPEPTGSNSDQWEAYLQRMAEDEWADHIIVQALANMLCVDIFVLCTIGSHEQHIRCSSSPVGAVNIGLIGELHYVALEPEESDSHTQNNTESESQTSSAQAQLSQNTDEQEEYQSEVLDDDEAARELTQIKGQSFESGLHKEGAELDADQAYSVASAEGQKPLNLFADERFEELSNPTKYPHGRGGINTKRERSITLRKYFNQRLLHVDGRFARDVECCSIRC